MLARAFHLLFLCLFLFCSLFCVEHLSAGSGVLNGGSMYVLCLPVSPPMAVTACKDCKSPVCDRQWYLPEPLGLG